MRKIIKRLKVNNSGMMMSEIIIAFAVLMICAGTLAVCIRFSSNMMMAAKDKDMEYTKFHQKVVEKFETDAVVADASKDAYEATPDGEINYVFAGKLSMKLDTASVNVEGQNITFYSTKNEK